MLAMQFAYSDVLILCGEAEPKQHNENKFMIIASNWQAAYFQMLITVNSQDNQEYQKYVIKRFPLSAHQCGRER